MPLREIHPLGTAVDKTELRVDIVAVHGLNIFDVPDDQYAWDTWRKPQGDGHKTWLEDCLPKHTPQAHISLYEYKSTVAFGHSKQQFYDIANDLLEVLRLGRRPNPNRPLVFLAHSLGGLLVEQALVNAKNNSFYNSILNSTTGLALFGTPHVSSNSSKTALGAAAGRIAEILHVQSLKAILETLNSGVLFADLISEHWRHQLEDYDIKSFWEGQGDVVPKASAIFGLPGTRENVIMLDTTHSDLCRFDDSQGDQDNLNLVVGNIQDLYTKALDKIADEELRNDQEKWKILNWISRSNFEAAHQVVRKKHTSGTGKWFVESDLFVAWHSRREPRSGSQDGKVPQIFWLVGMPGAGKTVMTSTVIEHLKERFPRAAIAYVYCERQNRQQQTMVELLASLLKQLLIQNAVPYQIKDLYKKHAFGNMPLTEKDCEDGLVDVLKSSGTSFLVVDALDESMNPDDEDEYISTLRLLDLLVAIMKRSQSECKLFVTSRKDCKAKYKDLNAIEYYLRARDEDIEQYVESWWGRSNKSNWSTDLKRQTLQHLTQNADGLFLLPVLHTNALAKTTTPKKFKNELNTLPTTVFNRYKEAMDRIGELPDEQKLLANKVLCWVSSAAPPLFIGALQHALALDADEDEEFDFEQISDDQSFIEYTAGLVTFEAEEVHLIHSTVREFFKRESTFPDANPTILKTCISYLLLKDFEDTCEDLPKRYERYPFLHYATFNWASYAAKCWQAIDEDLRSRCLVFVTQTHLGCLQVLATRVLNVPRPMRIAGLLYSPLHVAVLCRAEILLPNLLHANRSGLEATEHKKETPLHLAARSLSVQLVKILLAQGADVNATNYSGKTALDMIMLGPYDKVVDKMRKQKFEKSIDMFLNTYKIRQKVSEDKTHKAQETGPEDEVVVQIAMREARLDLKFDMEAWDRESQESERNRLETKLLAQSDLAMELSDEAAEIAETLVEHNVNLVTRAVTGHSALQLAALYGRESTVRKLLDHDANPFLEGGLGYTALQLASLRSHTKIEEILSKRMDALKAKEEGLEPALKTTIPGPCQAKDIERKVSKSRGAALNDMISWSPETKSTSPEGDRNLSVRIQQFEFSVSKPRRSGIPSSPSPAGRVSTSQGEDEGSPAPSQEDHDVEARNQD